jgi:hypothetical protein
VGGNSVGKGKAVGYTIKEQDGKQVIVVERPEEGVDATEVLQEALDKANEIGCETVVLS